MLLHLPTSLCFCMGLHKIHIVAALLLWDERPSFYGLRVSCPQSSQAWFSERGKTQWSCPAPSCLVPSSSIHPKEPYFRPSRRGERGGEREGLERLPRTLLEIKYMATWHLDIWDG
ncbi:hypothetical protein QBC35DRAFT_486628 [Podospora australis]|uniref:Uncharacterized protein n=1 Tax=Podospora australis TaxID=1536484 RepID=A0AAN6X584_9PEZI|nr:hypothetical protein QBC35DRAFT_486628 [Podospora australis]